MASQRNGTLYTGSTDDPARRIGEHRSGHGSVFAKRHKVFDLVYLEAHDRALDAINWERQIKKWNRLWKLRLIEEQNPDWRDLYDDLNNWI